MKMKNVAEICLVKLSETQKKFFEFNPVDNDESIRWSMDRFLLETVKTGEYLCLYLFQ